MPKELVRCQWCLKDEQEMHYHDLEWGVPVHDDNKHFEFIVLDTFQAGLSWRTILHKREHFRKAFDQFNYKKIAKYDDTKIQALLQNEGIIRNKLKINATVTNAKAFIAIQKEFGSFDAYIWKFVNFKTINNKVKLHEHIKPTSKESDAMSKDLYARGFKFVGSTICYAYMQAAGLVNDHLTACFRYKQV
ncbi:MAG: DNA-3-methyladenine glycosylase I [Chitinophagaceae bacterium]